MNNKGEFPFLTTHVANIALNKSIALPFLLSHQQKTFGFTEYSGESYMIDKLSVARWMILVFAKLEEGQTEEPWIELPEWQVPKSSTDGAKTMGEYDGILRQIEQEAKKIKNIWDEKNPKAVLFLKRMIAQCNECIWYTHERLTAIKVCSEMGPMAEINPDALFNGGSNLAQKIMGSELAMMGGYLLIKNEISSKKILPFKLLAIILSFLVEKAVKEGYTKPVEEAVS